MRASRVIHLTFLNLGRHAFRSFLAALGVVLGVGAVVAMLAVSEGAKSEALEQIQAQGIDNIVVRSVRPSAGAGGSDDKSSVQKYGIRQVDVAHIETTFENIRTIVPVRDMQRDIYTGGRLTDIRLMGTHPEFLQVTRSGPGDSRSRFLTGHDGRERKAVCVLGQTAARKLFQYRDPIGETVSISGVSFQVVGLLENTVGAHLGGVYNLNNLVYVPLETANAVYGNLLMRINSRTSRETIGVDVDYLYLTVADLEFIDDTAARLRTYFETKHDRLDYAIRVPYELLRQQEATQRIFTIVMASIAAISLLVGGIGIMNIMLANVYERTREIGTRRAVGARRRDILVQFLAESVVLTGIGGCLGLAVGVGLAALIRVLADMATQITPLSIIISLAVSVLTGITFGTHPAWKAANLDPIEALRHE